MSFLPAYRVQPRGMWLPKPEVWDFASSLPDGWTLTRAGPGRYIDSSLRLASAGADVARFTHFTGGSGLLVQPERTDLLTYSEDYTQSVWTKLRIVVGTGGTGPDGSTAARLVRDDGTLNNTHRLLVSVTATAGTTYAMSACVKGVGRDIGIALPAAVFGSNLKAFFDLSSGNIGFSNNGVTASIDPLADGWYWITAYATATISAAGLFEFQLSIDPYTSSTAGIVYDGDGASGIFLAAAQVEAGAGATMPIATAGSTAARAADVLSRAMDDGTYLIALKRRSGSTMMRTVVSGGGYMAPTDPSPLQRVTAWRIG